ncbi:hypothetical protein L0156_10220 [bacterium]|nr:hypothetical protein [bacterium]
MKPIDDGIRIVIRQGKKETTIMNRNLFIVFLFALTLFFGREVNAQHVYTYTYTDPHNVYILVSKEKGSTITHKCVIKFDLEVIAATYVHGEEFLRIGSSPITLDKLYVTFKGPNGAPYIGVFEVNVESCEVFSKGTAEPLNPPIDYSKIKTFDNKARSQYTNHQIFSTRGSGTVGTSAADEMADVALFAPGLATGTVANDYCRYSIKDDGLSAGQKKTLFNNPPGTFILGGTISRDGKIAVQFTATSSTSWKITTVLVDKGNPKQSTSWSVPPYSSYSLDISGPVTLGTGAGGISQTVRYLVFRAFRNVGTANQQSQLQVQTIDATTGKPIGAPMELTPFAKAANGNFRIGSVHCDRSGCKPCDLFLIQQCLSTIYCQRFRIKFHWNKSWSNQDTCFLFKAIRNRSPWV